MVKVTQQQFKTWDQKLSMISDRVGELQSSSIALSPVILKILTQFGAGNSAPVAATASEPLPSNPFIAGILKYLQKKLVSGEVGIAANDAVSPLTQSRGRDEIISDIVDLIGALKTAWKQDFDDCIETTQLPNVGSDTEFITQITGKKVDPTVLRYCILTLQQIKTDVELCGKFNQTDFVNGAKDGLLNLPKTLVENVENYLAAGFKNYADGEQAVVKATSAAIDDLIDYLNPSNYPECNDKPQDPVPPDDKDPIPVPSPDPTPTPTPAGDDCCTQLVASIDRLQNLRTWFNLVIKWIRDTRIELKEARQDLKTVLGKLDNLYTWIRDTRIELAEARRDNKTILANQDTILSTLYDIQLAIADNNDEIVKTQKLVNVNTKLLSTGLSGITHLITGITATLGAILAALQADLAALQTAITVAQENIQSDLYEFEIYVTGQFLETQANFAKLMLQLGQGFLRIEQIINPYITGHVVSEDWVQMTKAEQAAADKTAADAQIKLEKDLHTQAEQIIDPASAIVLAPPVAITVTKAIALTALKLSPQTLVYAGYGILGVVDLIQKAVSIVNDLQGDVKEPATLSLTTIEVPVIKWFPDLYESDKNGERKYSKLAKPKDKNGAVIGDFYQPPDYSASTPYIALTEIQVPTGMEKTYLHRYNDAIDEFFHSGDGGIILMPDGWEQKPMKYRPQLEFYCVAVNPDGTFDRKLNYTLNVQHYNFEKFGRPKKSPIPDYTKGKVCGVMKLDDGAKDIIFAKDKDEVFNVMKAIYEITLPDFTKGIDLTSVSKNSLTWMERDINPNGDEMKEVDVTPVWCDYYSKGRINRTYAIQRDWRQYFDRVTLF